VTADQLLRAHDRNAKQRRQTIDMAAAAVLLQAWLDGRRGDDPPPAPEAP
jgi:RNase H-fold protein (predicted Holliday junction resolvase)